MCELDGCLIKILFALSNNCCVKCVKKQVNEEGTGVFL